VPLYIEVCIISVDGNIEGGREGGGNKWTWTVQLNER